MSENAALIAVLVTDRPLCLPRVSHKSGLARDEVESYLRRVAHVITLKRGTAMPGVREDHRGISPLRPE